MIYSQEAACRPGVLSWLGLLVIGSYRDAIRVAPRIRINKEEI